MFADSGVGQQQGRPLWEGLGQDAPAEGVFGDDDVELVDLDEIERFQERSSRALEPRIGDICTLPRQQHTNGAHGWPKRGMHLFFGDGPLGARSEIAPPPHGAPRGVQLDRSALEETLLAQEPGLRRGWTVEGVEIGPPHRVRIAREGGAEVLSAPWVVDATGRRRLLSRQERWVVPSEHDTRARWLWLEGLEPLELARDNPTLHLAEPGAWTWIIPQGADRAAIGSVGLSNEISPLQACREAGLGDWIDSGRVTGRGRGQALASSSTVVVDPRGLALVGDAAGFTDPLFSPGLDEIAYGVDGVTAAVLEPSRVGAIDALLRNRLAVGQALIPAHYAALGAFGDFRLHYVGLLAQYFRQLALVVRGEHLDAPAVPVRAVQAYARRLESSTTSPPSERIHDNSLDVPGLRARASELDAFELHRRLVRLVADPDRTMDMAALAERLVAPGRRRGRGAVNEVANVPPDQ